MTRRASTVLLVLGLVILGACSVDTEGDDDDSLTTSTTRGTDNEDVRFLNVTHDDGTEYRCIWRKNGESGGLWCETRSAPTTTTTTEESPFD